MLYLLEDLVDGFSIPVLLTPINCSPAQFAAFTSLITAVDSVPFGDIAINMDKTRRETTPFKQQTDDCRLRFRFTTDPRPDDPWGELQAHRRVLCVIGVCDCAASGDLAGEYDSFVSNVVEKYRWCTVSKFFGFNPLDHQTVSAAVP